MSIRPTDSPCVVCGKTLTAASDAPLTEMPCGCKLRVLDLVGSPALRSRLYAMGILPDTEMEVCQSGNGAGNVCVRIRQSSLVLSEDLAKSIYCRAITDNDDHSH